VALFKEISVAAKIGDWDSAVGIATGYGLDGRGIGVRVPVGAIFYSSSRPPDRLGPTRPPIQWVSGTASLGVKRPGSEAGNSS
jgi:hypothetical protein